jgi:hypothetical protein
VLSARRLCRVSGDGGISVAVGRLAPGCKPRGGDNEEVGLVPKDQVLRCAHNDRGTRVTLSAAKGPLAPTTTTAPVAEVPRNQVLRCAHNDGDPYHPERNEGSDPWAPTTTTAPRAEVPRNQVLRCGQNDRDQCHPERNEGSNPWAPTTTTAPVAEVPRDQVLRCAQNDRGDLCHPERSEGSDHVRSATGSDSLSRSGNQQREAGVSLIDGAFRPGRPEA